MKKFIVHILLVLFLCIFLGPLSSRAEAAPFMDVKGSWAEHEITYLFENGIIGGYPDGTFKPNRTLTRYQAAAMLVKALDLPVVETANTEFKDIAENSPMYPVAASIDKAGIIRGSNGEFRPGEPLTRAQISTTLTKAYDLKWNENFYFTDIQPDYWNYTDIAAIADEGITGEKGDGTFSPSDSTTSAQFSVFLYRAIKQNRVSLKPLAGSYGGYLLQDGLLYGGNYSSFTISEKQYDDQYPIGHYYKTIQSYYEDDMGLEPFPNNHIYGSMQIIDSNPHFLYSTEDGIKSFVYHEATFTKLNEKNTA